MIAELGLAALWLAAALALLQLLLALGIGKDAGLKAARPLALVQGALTLIAFAMLITSVYNWTVERVNRVTRVAQALAHYAFRSGRVSLVRAHTLPQENASTRVLTKCGFDFVGEVIDPEDGLVWRWELPCTS